MLRCRDVNLKLNPKKFQFKVKQVTWMGHFLSSTGVTPHPDRVQAIKDMTPLHNVKRGSAVPGYVQLFVALHPKPCRIC